MSKNILITPSVGMIEFYTGSAVQQYIIQEAGNLIITGSGYTEIEGSGSTLFQVKGSAGTILEIYNYLYDQALIFLN